MKEKFFNLFNNGENQVFSNYCPVCNLHYKPLEAKVLEEGINSHLLYIKCQNCQSAVLTLVLNSNLGLTSIGLITDLKSDEVFKFKDQKNITYDDILEFHQLIKKEKALINYLDR